MNAHYLKRRSLEIKEWWLLRRHDPRALARQQERESIAARADADNQAWLTDGSIGNPPPASSGPIGPAPRGPQPKELMIGGGILVVLLLILAGIGSTIEPKEPVSAAAYSTPTQPAPGTTSTKTRPTAAPDLDAVPVGQPRTVEGEYDGARYRAKVTVTDVVRTTDSTVIVKAKIDVIEGDLPLDDAWSARTASGQNHPGFLNGDAAFGDVVDGNVEGEVEFLASEDARLNEIRLQPRHQKYGHIDSLNETAIWTIGKISTSITTTEPEPVPTTTQDSGSGGGNAPDSDVPDVDVPDVDLPNVGVGDCVNHHRRSNGHFC